MNLLGSSGVRCDPVEAGGVRCGISTHPPKCVFNWLILFLIGRSHTTKSACAESSPLSINLSIVQGSGIGPTFYIILESDLKPVSNVII